MKKILIVSVLLLLSARPSLADPRCNGKIELLSEAPMPGTYISLVIGDRVVARKLTKASPAFKTFLSDCQANSKANDNPQQCGGSLTVSMTVVGSINFYLHDVGDAPHNYQSLGHDVSNIADPYIADLRQYCESTLAAGSMAQVNGGVQAAGADTF